MLTESGRLQTRRSSTSAGSRFAQNLRALRERAGLTQKGLALRLSLDGPSTVSLWESGRILPAPSTIGKLATALRCSPAELLTGVVSPYEALRGVHELAGPELLLSTDEARLVRLWRTLAPEDRVYLQTVLLPALAAAHAAGRRRRTPGPSPRSHARPTPRR